MKKVLCILAVATVVLGVQAGEEIENSEPSPLGVGYQGMFFADGLMMNALSARWSPEPLGGQVLVGRTTSENNNNSAETSVLALQGKVFYTLIQRKNSQFYAGGKFGLLFGESTNAAGNKTDEDGLVLGALIGTEWRFSELPEIGFNFEVGYDLATTDNPDVDLTGITVSLGAHYYF